MNSKAREAADEIDACLARVLSAPEYLKAPGISELATIISRHFPPAEATQVAVEAAASEIYKSHASQPGDGLSIQRDVTRSIAAIISKHCSADTGAPDGFYWRGRYAAMETERDQLRAELSAAQKAIKIRDTFISGDEAATGLSEIACFLDPHFTGREGRAMTWQEIIERISDINREKEDAHDKLEPARTDAIRDAVEKLRAARITGFNGVGSETMKEACIAALASLTKKEGDDGAR
jgi:hypothetical protein